MSQQKYGYIQSRWYARTPGVLRLLIPLEWLFTFLAKRRRVSQTKKARQTSASTPVVVIGNISVGGTGKTPFLIALCQLLEKQGYKIGIVTRGYGRETYAALWVNEYSKAKDVGDEALEIFSATDAQIYVESNRARAIKVMRDSGRYDIILSDDGMQHYLMDRQFEVAVISSSLGFGNGHCLPVGPLRERPERLDTVDLIAINDTGKTHSSLRGFNLDHETYKVEARHWVNVRSGAIQTLDFVPGNRICAYAGIGQPGKFFASLDALGLRFTQAPREDHSRYSEKDFKLAEYDAYVMTRKDAVKCRDIAHENSWYLEVEATLPAKFKNQLVQRISTLVNP
jgi:tetraacyldisaccharide 4'-kinase